MRFNLSWYDLIWYPQPYDFSNSHDFTAVSRQWFSLFSLYWRSGANIYTHKVPSDKSPLLYKASSVKSTPCSPPLFHHEDATEIYPLSNYSGNIYLQLWVALFQLSVSRFSEMQFDVIYLETRGSTQPYFAFLTLAFCSHFLVFGGSHMAPNSLTLLEPVSVVFCIKFFCLVHRWGLVFFVLQSILHIL
jgi:hypothetical protein